MPAAIHLPVSQRNVGHGAGPSPLGSAVHATLVAPTDLWGHSSLLPGYPRRAMELCSQGKECHHKPASGQ